MEREIGGLYAPTSRLKKIFSYFESLLTVYLQKIRVCPKCDIYLIGCIWKYYSINCELSAPSSDQLCCSLWLMGQSNNSGCVFSPGPALYRGSQGPACSVTAPSYSGHQSEWLLPVKLGRTNCSLAPLLWFTWLSDFYNTAHQDRHHAREWGPFLITALWHSWWHSSPGEPHVPLRCRLPGLSFHGHVISRISECPALAPFSTIFSSHVP